MPRHGVVGLRERLEDLVQLLRRHTHAGIRHLEEDAGSGRFRHNRRAYFQPYAAGFRELDGVAQQVDRIWRSLVGSVWIVSGISPAYSTCKERFLAIALERIKEATSLTMPQGEHRIRSMVILPASILEMSRMSLMIPGKWLPLRWMVLRNLRVRLRRDHSRQEEIGIAEDGGHGRADFMAHVGEELAFCPIRPLGGLFGHQKFEWIYRGSLNALRFGVS